VAPLHDVKPASGARIDLDAYGLSPRRRKQPFACGPRIEPGIEDALRRGAESARDTGIDSLLEVNGNRHSLSSSRSNGGGPSSLMMDDKRARALSSQIGHDLSRDLTLIAPVALLQRTISTPQNGACPRLLLWFDLAERISGIRLNRWRGRWNKARARPRAAM